MRRALGLMILAIVVCVPMRSLAVVDDRPLQALGFLSGRWTAESPDGQEEEYWSQAIGSSMVGTFRVVKDGDAAFYEFWAIEIENGKIIFKMKHFNRGLVGWEEKADIVRLMTSINRGQDVLFSNPDSSLTLRYQRHGDELVSTLRRVKDGKPKEDVFRLHRSR